VGAIDLDGHLAVSAEGFHSVYSEIGCGALESSSGTRQSAGDRGLFGRHYVETPAPAFTWLQAGMCARFSVQLES
ncbi:uncharacterized protein METZ01_LOCUS13624, partial [marine metagenome]